MILTDFRVGHHQVSAKFNTFFFDILTRLCSSQTKKVIKTTK